MNFVKFLFLIFIFFFPGVVFDFVFYHEYLKVLSVISPVCLSLFGTCINRL